MDEDPKEAQEPSHVEHPDAPAAKRRRVKAAKNKQPEDKGKEKETEQVNDHRSMLNVTRPSERCYV